MAEVSDRKSGVVVPDRYLKMEGVSVEACFPPASRLRLFLQAPVGEGKTTFGCSVPRSILFDFENKATAVLRRAPGSIVVHKPNGEGYDRIVDMLVADAEHRPFDTVIFDPIKSYVGMQRATLTREYKAKGLITGKVEDIVDGYKRGGAGWDTINRKICDQLTRLYQAGYGWIVTAHAMQILIGDGKDSQYVWTCKVNEGVREYLHREAEYTGMLNRAALLKTKGKEKPSPAKQTITLKGIEIAPAGNSSPKTTYGYYLKLFPGQALETREHVRLPPEPIEVPEGEGFERFSRVYREACEKLQEQELKHD